MRPARLAVLLGTLAAGAALYLPHLSVDGARWGALTGGSLPSIWQELGHWGRPAAALLAAALVAAAFRPRTGWSDAGGAAAAGVLAAGGLAGAWLARRAAGADAAVVAAALRAADGSGADAAPGAGFWLLLAGAGLATIGACWDLVEARRCRGRRGRSEPGSIGEEDPPVGQ